MGLTKLLASLMFGIFACGIEGSAHAGVSDDLNDLHSLLVNRASLTSTMRWTYCAKTLSGKPAIEFMTGDAEKDLLAARNSISLADLKEDKEHFTTGEIVYDFIERRFHNNMRSVKDWVGGSANEISTRRIRAFDGEQFSKLWRTEHGTNLPTDLTGRNVDGSIANKNANAEISVSTKEKDSIKGELRTAGIWAFAPNIFIQDFVRDEIGQFNIDTTEFLELLRKHILNVKFAKESSSKWVVRFSIPKEEHKFRTCLYEFNPEQGGIVTRVAAMLFDSIVEETIFENKEWQPGIWAPARVTNYSYSSGIGARLDFRMVVANPPIGVESFTIAIPERTFVRDNVNNMRFAVAETVQSDAASLKKYAEEHQLKLKVKPQSRALWIFRPLAISTFLIVLAFVALNLWPRLR